MNINYKFEFSFKMLLVAIKRNILTLVYFFLCFTVIGGIYAFAIDKPVYQSSGVVEAGQLTEYIYNTFVRITQSKVPSIVIDNILENNIMHKDGTNISITEIENGFIIPEKPSTITTDDIELSFQNEDESIVKEVMNIILEKTCEVYNANDNSTSFSVVKEASDTKVTTNPVTKLLTFSALGIGVGFVFALASGVHNYSIDSVSELNNLDIATFEVSSKGGKKHE